jgi:hypothetical protein
MTSHAGNPPSKPPAAPRRARVALLAVILLAAAFLRFRDLNYSTPFVDEASFVRVGEAVLDRPLEEPYSKPLNFMFGWYVWPVLAALGDSYGGIAGVRALCATMGTLTVLGIFLFARELFGDVVALASALLLAFLGPAVHISRLGSYDATALCFLVFALWLYAKAWKKDWPPLWLGSGLLFFISFLSKYFVALYFPFLVLAVIRKGKKPLRWFSLPLAALCAAFLGLFLENMKVLIRFGQQHVELTAPAGQLWGTYVSGRIEFWALLFLALFSWFRWPEVRRGLIPLVWLGALVLIVFQWWSRADFNFWKHVNYPLLFVVPLAAAGTEKLFSRVRIPRREIVMPVLILPLAALLAWKGLAFEPRKFAFWPDVGPIVKFMESRTTLESRHRVLADDLVFQFYYFDKSLKATQTTSPYYFRYGGFDDARAYAAAVRDGLFDYVVFDGWAAPKSTAMRNAVRSVLPQRYTQRLDLRIRQMGGRLEVYELTRRPRFAEVIVVARFRAGWPLVQSTDLQLALTWALPEKRVFQSDQFQYADLNGLKATRQAIRERFFPCVILGGVPGDAEKMEREILRRDLLSAQYVRWTEIPDEAGGETFEIFVPAETKHLEPRIEIAAPNHGEIVRTEGIETVLRGRVFNAEARWTLRAEVYTNRWYPQGEAFAPAPDGTFSQTIYLGGPCEHLIRVRLFDETGRQRAVASSYGVLRANPDGGAPRCP